MPHWGENVDSYEGHKCQIQVGRVAGRFGSANAATVILSPTKLHSNVDAPFSNDPSDLIDCMDGYLDNMDNAVTNEKTVLKQLVTTKLETGQNN